MSVLSIIFIATFIGGLMLGVLAMLHGVEHLRRNRERAPSPFFNLPTIAAFAVGFGAAGYPLASRTRLPTWSVLLIAIGAGALAISGTITLLATWALRGVSGGPTEEIDIQGQLAVVTRDVSATAAGEISYQVPGKTIKVAARALNGASIAAGSDVVIDRIEGGVAYIEEWAAVEQRL